MKTSGFWEDREDKSHLEEKYSQTESGNSSPLGSSFTYCPGQDKGGSSKWDSIESLWNCVQAAISGYDWDGRYVHRSRCEVKNYVQHLSQISALINDLSGIRDLSPTGLLYSFEHGDKVLLNTWRTGSPVSQLEEKRTGISVKQTFILCLVGVCTPLQR